MYRLYLMILVLFIAFPGNADSVIQTDWSSGPGLEGPVYSCGRFFDSCTSIDWFDTSGQLTLGSDRADTQITLSSDAIGWVYPSDMDMDGDADIIGCDHGAGSIRLWENLDGLGGAWSEQELVEVPWAEVLSYVVAADLDEFGPLDIAISYKYGARVIVVGEWPDFWIDVPLEQNTIVGILLPCDVDGDGDIDLIAQRELSWYWCIEVYQNSGYGIYWNSYTEGACISDMKLADLDGDGDQDIAAARYWGGGVAWFENLPGCNFTLHIIKETSGAYAVGTGDLDGDGDIDIVADFGSMIEWYENDLQNTNVWRIHSMSGLSGINWPVMSLDDFDHDGDVDIARRAEGILRMAWNDDHGEAWTSESVSGAGGGSGGIRSSDLDADGIPDLLASWTYSGLKWYRFTEPATAGELTSSIVKLPEDPHWSEITWEYQQSSGTSLAFQVRSSDDPDDMGEWSDTLTVSGTSLQGILQDYDNYLQYRVLMSTLDPDSTPVLQEICITYDPLGIPEEVNLSLELNPVEPNPSRGYVEFSFYLQSEGSVVLSVYDITGRIVSSATMEDLPGGDHSMQFAPPNPGMYFVLIRSGEWTAIRRFVAI